jgi:hypothetical protein
VSVDSAKIEPVTDWKQTHNVYDVRKYSLRPKKNTIYVTEVRAETKQNYSLYPYVPGLLSTMHVDQGVSLLFYYTLESGAVESESTRESGSAFVRMSEERNS